MVALNLQRALDSPGGSGPSLCLIQGVWDDTNAAGAGTTLWVGLHHVGEDPLQVLQNQSAALESGCGITALGSKCRKRDAAMGR